MSAFNASPDLIGLFADVTIIEIGQFVAAPIASELFAHGGADVIRIEPVSGDVTRVTDPLVDPNGDGFVDGRQYVVKARGKRAIPVKLGSEEGDKIVAELIARADVFIHNLRPGTAPRLGLDFDGLHARHPGLVYGEINGFGETGPLASRPSLDLIAQSWSGLRTSSGATSEGHLARYEAYFCDYIAGLLLAFGVASALRERERTGLGQKVTTSLAQAGLYAQHRSASLFESTDGWKHDMVERRRNGEGFETILPDRFAHTAPDVFFFNTYPTSNGAVAVGATGGMGPKFCGLFDTVDPRTTDAWADRQARPELLAKTKAHIAAGLVLKSTDEAVEFLDAAGIPVAPVRLLEELLVDPDAHASGLVYRAEHPRFGEYVMPGPAVTFSGNHYHPRPEFAAHGEHTDQLLDELGYDQTTIDRLVADGIIGRAANDRN